MFRVEVHEYITRISSVYYRVGAWHKEDEPTVAEMRLKIFYSAYYLLYITLILVGALGADDMDEFIFLMEFMLMVIVMLAKFLSIIWRKKGILDLFIRICCYSVEDDATYIQVKEKLYMLMNFVVVFLGSANFCMFCMTVVVPFLGGERTLYFNIGFPLDWKNNEFAYWIAFTFMITQAFTTSIAASFSAIIWYLMTNCGLRFKVLGQQIKTMGKVKSVERIGIANERKISDTERDSLYLRDLLECIASHIQLKEWTNELDSFLSELFLAQLTTSASCICCSIYSIAFCTDATLVEYITYIITLLYNIFDIFMIMNLGNEIESTSDRLSYCLFESDWTDRPQSTKKIVLIFGECLKTPHQLVVLKLYPLNLEMFTRILNSAYSSFNILQNFK